MEHNNPLAKRRLGPGRGVDARAYFQGLLAGAGAEGFLDAGDLERIQLEAAQLLSRASLRYTGGASSSIRVETAQGLFESLVYTLGAALKSFPDEEAAVALRDEPLFALWEQGQRQLAARKAAAPSLLARVRESAPKTASIAYRDMLFGPEGLGAFPSAYDPDFGAQETPCVVDYPLSGPERSLAGIEYWEETLSRLELENRFCRRFDPGAVHRLLLGADKGYVHLLLNLFDQVLAGALGCALAGRPPLLLALEAADLPKLAERLTPLSPRHLTEAVLEAARRLPMEPEPILESYVGAAAERFAVRLQGALAAGSLARLLPLPARISAVPSARFVDGPRMADSDFRRLMGELDACRFGADRLALVGREIHSIADLGDLLDTGCLSAQEACVLFAPLGDGELALLLSVFTTGEGDPAADADREWRLALARFLEDLPPARREAIFTLCRDEAWQSEL